MFFGREIPEWELGEFDQAYLEGWDESHFNNVGLCPKCGTVRARDWCCEWCGSDLERCSPRLRVALFKSSAKPDPWPWRRKPLPRHNEVLEEQWAEDVEIVRTTAPTKKWPRESVGLFAFRLVDVG